MKRYLAELIGTFVLVFGGCGAAVLAGDKIGFAGVAFAFGFSLLAMVYAIGPVSGCHINPAVTLGLLLSGKFEAKYAPGYIVAQIAGGIIAAGVLLIVAGGTTAGYDPSAAGFAANGYGAHSPGGYNLIAAFVAETIGLAAARWPTLWLGLYTSDPTVLDSGSAYLRTVGPCFGFYGLGYALYCAGQGTGRMEWPVTGALVRAGIAIAGGALVLRFDQGLNCIFLAAACAMVVFGCLSLPGLVLQIGYSPRA